MMFSLKDILQSNQLLYKFAQTVGLIQDSSFVKIDGSQKKYPKVIQLPITYKCNSRCVMCNIWQMDHSNEMSLEEFSDFLNDPIFKKVEAVGINGGEPSLIHNLPEYAKEILKLPRLKSLNIISHGFNQIPLLKSIEEIYNACRKKGVHFHVSISLDGVGEIHDNVRGRSKVFDKVVSSINTILNEKHKYCDSFDIACTVVRQNIDNLIELDVFVRLNNLPIKYRLGIENKRIQSDKLRDSYSVIDTHLRQSAKEFFHYQFSQAKSLQDKFKYYSIFYWLCCTKPKRLLGCIWKDEGITLDSRGDLYFCAVASEKIGSLRFDSGEKIFFSDENLNYRKNIILTSCDNCIHDYCGKPELRNIALFLKYILLNRFAMNIYKYRCKFGLI